MQLSPRLLLTSLQSGQHAVLVDPRQPEKVITQASRVADVYYLVGPLFNELIEVELQPLFEVASQHGDDEASTVALLNKFIGDHGAPLEAQVYTCAGLDEALATLAGLLAAYSLPTAS